MTKSSRLEGTRSYLLLFLPHILIAGAGSRLITLIHELGHAIALWAMGGEVLEIRTTHSPQGYGVTTGRVPLEPPFGISYDAVRTIMAAGPTILWTALLAIGVAIAVMRPRLHRYAGAAIFFWLYFVPLYDTFGQLIVDDSPASDLGSLGGEHVLALRVSAIAAVVALWLAGHRVQRRLLGSASASFATYAFATFVTWFGVFMLALTVIPLTQDP